MQKLDLLEEVEEESKAESVPVSAHVLQRDASMISNRSLIPRLALNKRDPETDYLNKPFALKRTF